MTHPGRPVRILIVDEEEALTRILSIAIGLEGWEARVARDAASAILAVDELAPDIVLLDRELPDRPGTEVAATLREHGVATPIVFLTGRATAEDRLAGYAAGADGYITKPFGLEEVVEQLRPLVRRLGLAPTSRRVGDLVLDDATGQAWLGGEYLPLHPLEFEMLRALAERPGSRRSVGELLRSAASRGVRLSHGLARHLVAQLQELVNAERRGLLQGDDATGWVLAAA